MKRKAVKGEEDPLLGRFFFMFFLTYYEKQSSFFKRELEQICEFCFHIGNGVPLRVPMVSTPLYYDEVLMLL